MLTAQFNEIQSRRLGTPEFDKNGQFIVRVANVIALLLQLVSAGLLLGFYLNGNIDYQFPMKQEYLEFTETESGNFFVLQKETSAGKSSPAVALIVMCLITALFSHGLTLIPPVFKVYYRLAVRGLNLFNWLEYSVTASIMMYVLLLLNGVSDFVLLIAVCTLIGYCQLLGGLVPELMVYYGVGKTPGVPRWAYIWVPYIITFTMILVPWIVFFVYYGVAIQNRPPGAEGPPWWLNVAFASTFFTFNLFGLWFFVQRYVERSEKPAFLYKRPYAFILGYVVLSMMAKLPLTWFIAGGIFSRE